MLLFVRDLFKCTGVFNSMNLKVKFIFLFAFCIKSLLKLDNSMGILSLAFHKRMKEKFDNFFTEKNINGISRSAFIERISLLVHAPVIVLSILLLTSLLFDYVFFLVVGSFKTDINYTDIVVTYILGLGWIFFFKYQFFFKKRYYLLANNFISVIILILCLLQGCLFYYMTGAYNFTLALIFYPILVGIGLSSASPQKSSKKVYYLVMVLSLLFALITVGVFEIYLGAMPFNEAQMMEGNSFKAIIINIFNSKYPVFSNTLIGIVSVYLGISSEKLYAKLIKIFNRIILFISRVLASDSDLKH